MKEKSSLLLIVAITQLAANEKLAIEMERWMWGH